MLTEQNQYRVRTRTHVEPLRISRLKFAFKQTVIRKNDEKVMLNALVIGTSVNEKGRPFLPEQIDNVFKTTT